MWSRKLGAFNVGEPTAIIFELAVSDLRADMLFGYYQALTNESFLIRFDIENGSILASRSFPNIFISDVTFLNNGWAFSARLDDKPLVALFDEAFNIVKVVGLNQDQISGRIYLKSNPLHGQLVVMISSFRSTGILTLDRDLQILESSQFKDFSLGDFQVFIKSNKAFLAMTGNSLKQNDDDLVYVSMPLLKEDRMCPGGEWCVQTYDAEIFIRSGVVVSQEFRLLVSTDRPVWRSLTGTSVAFCDDNPEKVGVEAFFNIRDTVCTGLPVEIQDLRNGGAVSVIWELEGSIGSNTSALNPGAFRYLLPGKYILRQTAFGVCSQDVYETELIVLQQPSVTLPGDTLLCSDSVFTVLPDFSSEFSGTWNDQPGSERVISQSGLYYFSVSNEDVCVQTDSFRVDFFRDSLSLSGLSVLCEGPFTLTNPLSIPFLEYSWSVDPPVLPDLEAVDLLYFDFLPADNYQISYSLLSDDCPLTASFEVVVLEAPKITPIPDQRLGKGSVFLQPQVSGDFSKVQWSDFSEQLSRNIENPGAYSLTVSNEGCSDSIIFIVYPAYSIFAPTAFRPEGSFNPLFRIYTNDEIQVDDLEIFDRWGNLLIKVDNQYGWDGTVKGYECLPGVFIYKAVGRTVEGLVVPLEGEVTLLR
jgi:hypothetical protein